MSSINELQNAFRLDHRTKRAGAWLVLAATVTVFLLVTTRIVFSHVANGYAPWHTDFAIFRQAGYLLSHDAAGEVYRYVPSTPEARSQLPPVWAEFVANHVTAQGEWEGYYYAQAPWQAVLMTPFASMSLRDGYLVFSLVMIASMLLAAGLLVRYTEHGWAWGSAFLLAPLVLPILAGNPWRTSQFVWLGDAPLRYGSTLGLTLWYGQYTPFLLGLLIVGLVATHRGYVHVAGLMVVLAMMKPTVLFVLPAFLLVIDDFDQLIDLVRWGAVWTVLFNVVFTMIPGLGYPWTFWEALTSYSGVSLPILFQAHNWVLYIGIPIAALALHYHGLPAQGEQPRTTE